MLSNIALLVPASDPRKRVPEVTPLLPSVTKAAVLPAILRLSVTFFVAALTFPVMAADSFHPLSVAARRAVTLCTSVEAESLDQCGTRMAGRSTSHTTARMAVKQYFDQLNAFMSACGQLRVACHQEAEWLTQVGINAGLQQPESYSLSK